MRLEFLKNAGGFDEHVIRLSDFNSGQAIMLFGALDRIIRHAEVTIDLGSLHFIQPVNCQMILRTSAEDIGISTSDQHNFICDLTTATYKTLAKLVEPFCRKESKGYQWLYDLDTPIGFLFSAGKDMPIEE